MTTIFLYLVFTIASFIGLTTLLNSLLINLFFFIFRYKNIETLRTFLGGFALWIGLVYLWKVIDGRQMPQLALFVCLIGLLIFLVMSSKMKQDKPDENTTKTIFSQIFSVILVLIFSFFIYGSIRWY